MTEKKDKKEGHNKGKKYDKPVSLHPLSTEEALEALLQTKPAEDTSKSKGEGE